MRDLFAQVHFCTLGRDNNFWKFMLIYYIYYQISRFKFKKTVLSLAANLKL